METKLDVSFIIVNFQSQEFLPECLSSIYKSGKCINFEVIIVNNDESVLNFPVAKVINSGRNMGFGSACNLGSRSAQGEILCFLNPDTEILSDIKSILDFFSSRENAGIIGPKLITGENKLQSWCAGCEPGLMDLVKNNLGFPGSRKIWESKKSIEADWVSGACLFIRKNVFQKINGFDEKFFMYAEDVDLCRRAREKGLRVIYSPEFSVRHFGGMSFKSLKDKINQKKLFYSSMFYYCKKYFWKKHI